MFTINNTIMANTQGREAWENPNDRLRLLGGTNPLADIFC